MKRLTICNYKKRNDFPGYEQSIARIRKYERHYQSSFVDPFYKLKQELAEKSQLLEAWKEWYISFLTLTNEEEFEHFHKWVSKDTILKNIILKVLEMPNIDDAIKKRTEDLILEKTFIKFQVH